MDREQAAEKMRSYRYNATECGGTHDDDADGTATYLDYITQDINNYFKERFKDCGVPSLASDWDNPLMWSHYADEHGGICIEYETDEGGHDSCGWDVRKSVFSYFGYRTRRDE